MGEIQLQPPSSSALDAIHERPINLRRARPPDIDVGHNENRVPLRAERASKRESKIGLRSIFARTKTTKTDKDTEDLSPWTVPRPAGIRASLADFGSWPYRLQSSRSEASLASPASVDPRSTPTGNLSPYRPPQSRSGTDKLQSIVPSSGRVVAAPWNPPPLFQVYPQAVKHATLPACNLSMGTLVRHSETRGGNLIQGTGIRSPELINDLSIKIKGDTLKKRQKVAGLRNSGEWTSKIFVLVTAGYLLQYAAEGSFNRVPEKILQLTTTSAAYASDLIPGRHWVLQVASTTDADGHTLMDSKSRRPKLSIRENRRVSNMLLVFENPESMDSWLAVLRREIEFHGGKRRMSETGKVEADDLASEVEAQPTQRNIVVKDRDRFSCVITRDIPSTHENTTDTAEADNFAISSPRRFSTYTIDGSPTASMISSDGQRLDNLRDSGSSHRFSYVSSGQRTMITSEGSSPACSPTRASFSSQGEDLQPLSSMPEVRLRPNAAAIVNRRQSMQTLISSFEAPIEQHSRPYAHTSSTLSHENKQLSTASVPNFSVPHAISKRFSLNTSMPSGLGQPLQLLDHERNTKASRKPPPTALLMSRPLSIVIDQPSPRSPCSPSSLSRSIDSSYSTPLESRYTTAVLDSPPRQTGPNQTHAARSSGINQITSDDDEQTTAGPGVDIASGMGNAGVDEQIPRAASSLDTNGAQRRLSRLSGVPSSEDSSNRRASFLSESHSFQSPPHSPTHVDEWKPILTDKARPTSKSSCSPKRSAPSLRTTLTVDSQEKLITTRRSMPHLNDGPPPAPPPSCALPPIPRKASQHTP
ncbi:hypothetical protein NUW58_g5744 [Xylaria curta]|uniref:Uncharacterized protein n=1 Tax=Xylaria curta TaxID=42375 RepID=A0ACC1P1M7_9PEZI|nr:hypothetical protein NUW58_g5744 [Xylaria curta]